MNPARRKSLSEFQGFPKIFEIPDQSSQPKWTVGATTVFHYFLFIFFAAQNLGYAMLVHFYVFVLCSMNARFHFNMKVC